MGYFFILRIMRFSFVLRFSVIFSVLLFFSMQLSYGQEGFTLPENVKRDKVSFELVNNLVIIPVELNGTKLSFLLDTGVSTTLLFSIAQNDSLQLKNAVPASIRGLGDGGSIDALKSQNNILRVGKAVDKSHSLYVIFDQSLNFSPRMGVPIHGILGYDFFKKFLVKTDYTSKKLTVYNPKFSKKNPCRSCEVVPLEFHSNKPFARMKVSVRNGFEDKLFLLDTGSSDALWLFDETDYISELPKNYFEDYLGLGLSGSIYGKRSKIESLSIGSYDLKEIGTSFPDGESLRNIVFFNHREGTIGAGILKRFTVFMDYSQQKMYLRKNSNFKKPFYYNMAGVTLQHDGTVTVKEVQEYRTGSLNMAKSDANNGSITIPVVQSYSLFLAPRIVVAELRENSPAAEAGLQIGDEVVTVNNKPAYKYKLYELSALFSSKAGRTIRLTISRNGEEQKIKFVLKKLL
ncbi:aspartyl protease [Marinirhabdus gelatinilytica]|uniref:Aspartyl protease n=2 Tax=Marinirhabdus gelatinilytica TaxID=1703343 RepID=A0A370Q8I1_9FLAO|nr:aspartyl protease [Marinirhabdus gelatinilytica]